MTNHWNAGVYTITVGSVVIGDATDGAVINAVNGIKIYALGDAATIYSSGRGVVVDAENIAGQFTCANPAGFAGVFNGFLKYTDGNQGIGKVPVSDAVGKLTLQTPYVYPLPAFVLGSTSAPSVFQSLAGSSIPGGLMSTEGDIVLLKCVVALTNGGSTDTSTTRLNLNGLPINGVGITVTNTDDHPIVIDVTLKRVSTNRIHVTMEYNFGILPHPGLDETYIIDDNTSVYNFANPIGVSIEGNQGTTGKPLVGKLAVGLYIKKI
jgi:hypothetical protein